MSEVSKGQKWRVNPFRTLEVQEMEYTYSSKNLRNYEKKWGLLENKIRHKFVLCWRSEINVSETWSFSLPGTWWKVSTKEVDLHWRKVCSTNSMFIIRSQKNIQQSFHSGHRATLYCEGLKCQQQFAQSCLQEGELSVEIDEVASRLA